VPIWKTRVKHTIAVKDEIDVLERQFLDLFSDNEFHYWKKLSRNIG
jgi:hypothetical protein